MSEKAEKLGRLYGKYIIELDGDVKKMAQVKGSGFWKNFSRGFKDGFKKTLKYTKKPIEIASMATGNPEVALGTEVLADVVGASRVGGADNEEWEMVEKPPKELFQWVESNKEFKKRIMNKVNEKLKKSRKVEGNKKTNVIIDEEKKSVPKGRGKKGKGRGGGRRKISDKMKRRNILVKKLMKKHKISLIQASKKIKSENISY